MRKLGVLALCLLLAACQRGPSGVAEKVMVDFGLREAPEGYERPSDRVFERLTQVGNTELARLNNENRHGEILFQEEGAIGGRYYKQVKRYESFHPLEAAPITRGSQGERGYTGYIEYTYSIYQSERRPNRTEAMALSANIPTGETGRDVLRYNFNSGGHWDGRPGERTRR